MNAQRGQLARSVEILLEHEAEESTRYVDVALSLRIADYDKATEAWVDGTDEELIEVGGRWDRRWKRWAGNARSVKVVRVPRGSDQELPARWLAEWFTRTNQGARGPHWDEEKQIKGPRISVWFRRVWTLMLAGGRRGGKSFIAVLALVIAMIMTPRSICCAVSPTQVETDELEREARGMMPSRWFSARLAGAGKDLQFKLANGSRLLFLSGHKPSSLKRGRFDVCLYNESQRMARAGWRQLRGAIADRSGLVILSCNPPDEPIGAWVEQLWEDIKDGAVAAESFHLVGKHNPIVDQQPLEDMRAEVDDNTARKEIDGEFGVPIGNVVFDGWHAEMNVRDIPAGFVDITAEFSKKHFGLIVPVIVGMDFQLTPHMAAAVYKVFADPSDAAREPLMWIVDEVVVTGNEDALIDGLEAAGYRGADAVVVMDASGFYQGALRDKDPSVKRRTSSEFLRDRGWRNLFPPQKDLDNNPSVSERFKITNARVKSNVGRRRLFSVPGNTAVNKAMRLYPKDKWGQASRKSEHSHLADAVSYPIYRFFWKPVVLTTAKYIPVKRFSRRDQFRGGPI